VVVFLAMIPGIDVRIDDAQRALDKVALESDKVMSAGDLSPRTEFKPADLARQAADARNLYENSSLQKIYPYDAADVGMTVFVMFSTLIYNTMEPATLLAGLMNAHFKLFNDSDFANRTGIERILQAIEETSERQGNFEIRLSCAAYLLLRAKEDHCIIFEKFTMENVKQIASESEFDISPLQRFIEAHYEIGNSRTSKALASLLALPFINYRNYSGSEGALLESTLVYLYGGGASQFLYSKRLEKELKSVIDSLKNSKKQFSSDFTGWRKNFVTLFANIFLVLGL
jgi:hypothetical protein